MINLMPMLPFASGGDLFGLLFFAIVVIISWLTNRARGTGEGEGGLPGAPKGDKTATDDTLEEWLKGLVEGPVAAPGEPPPPAKIPPRQPPPMVQPARLPIFAREQRRTPPPLRSESPRRAAPVIRPEPVGQQRHPAPVKPAPAVREPVTRARLVPSGTDIHAEVHEFSMKLEEEVRATPEELLGSQPQPGIAATIPGFERVSATSILHSRTGLRQGVILMEILGKPRAFAPPLY